MNPNTGTCHQLDLSSPSLSILPPIHLITIIIITTRPKRTLLPPLQPVTLRGVQRMDLGQEIWRSFQVRKAALTPRVGIGLSTASLVVAGNGQEDGGVSLAAGS